MNYSKQRERVLAGLYTVRNHPTADELYSYLKDNEYEMSMATVYRNLRLLSETGVIMRVPIPNGADRYDPVNDGHLHMVCNICGNITDIEKDAIPDIRMDAEKASGCKIDSYDIIFYGICKECAGCQ